MSQIAKIKNLNQFREFMLEELHNLREKRITDKELNASSSMCSNIIRQIKLELEISKDLAFQENKPSPFFDN